MTQPRPTLYLIDGYAQFFRAYHAIRTPMTSPVTKEPTNMTFGFVGMLLKLLKGEGRNLKRAGVPTHLAVVLDVSGDRGTFRSQLYPEYKATRKPPWPSRAASVEPAGRPPTTITSKSMAVFLNVSRAIVWLAPDCEKYHHLIGSTIPQQKTLERFINRTNTSNLAGLIDF